MRVETIGRSIHKQRRCLVALDGYYEWRPAETPAARQPFVLRDQGGHPLGVAGVWSRSTTGEGKVVDSVALIMCPPRPPVDTIHDRMPHIIPRAAYTRWIDADADVSHLLEPTATSLVATPVSTFVNSPRHDDPRCLVRAEVRLAQQGLF